MMVVRSRPPPDPSLYVPQWPDRLALRLPARAPNVARLRRALATWLGGDHVSADVVDDLVLATSEALENCCDHAYADADQPGTMTLRAHEGDHGTVISVGDDGRWQPPMPGPTRRGRGLEMIDELVDRFEFVATPGSGTQLVLHHHRDRS